MAKPSKKRSASTSRRSPCPVAATLDLVGDKWTLLVIRDLFSGKTRFKELAASPEGIATNILASRLERLVNCGLVKAEPSEERAGAAAYRLTDKGKSLLPLLAAMRDWGLAYVPGTETTRFRIRSTSAETRNRRAKGGAMPALTARAAR